MINAKLNWNGDKALASVKAASWQRVQRCVLYFWQKCVEAVGVSNPRPYKTPSAPGEPPRKRTGFGQRGIQYELNEKEGWGRVGATVNAIYMLYLDRGTKRVKARPWLEATLEKFIAQIKTLAGE